MTQLGSRSGPALRYLWTFSVLADHPKAGKALDRDRNCLNVETLDDSEWNWSSGERVLNSLAIAIALGQGGVRVSHLAQLDEHHREVALEVIRIWLCGEHETVIV